MAHAADEDHLLDMMMWAAALMPLPVGETLGKHGRYELREFDARTDHSAVYLAVDRRYSVRNGPESLVAVKVLLDPSAGVDEARFSRQVLHKNVLRMLDFGTAHGFTYLVSEYMSDGDLGLVTVPWEPRRAAALVAALADGLQALHSAGLVHGDIKPANILMHHDGEPRLADMEFASAPGHGIERDGGTLVLLAPERLESGSVATPASDIYALGGVLYWLLTSEYPHGSDRSELLERLKEKKPAPSPGISRDLDRVCLRALAVDPQQRHTSPADLADDLRRWLNWQPIEWLRPSVARRARLWSRRRPVRAIVAAVAAVLALAIPVTLHRQQLVRVEEAAAREREAIQTEARVEREALRRAEQQVEELRAILRGTIEMMYAQVAGPADRDLPTLLTSMYFFERFRDLDGLGTDFDRLVSSHVADAFARWRQSADAATDRSLFARLTRLAEMEAALGGGDAERVRNLLPRARADWEGVAPGDDPIWLALDAFELLSADDTEGVDESRRRVLIDALRRNRAFPATVRMLEARSLPTTEPGAT